MALVSLNLEDIRQIGPIQLEQKNQTQQCHGFLPKEKVFWSSKSIFLRISYKTHTVRVTPSLELSFTHGQWPSSRAPGVLLHWPLWPAVLLEAQRSYEEEAQPHLNGMNPGLGASYAFYCGDSSPVQRADGDQAGVGCMMASECKREAQSTLCPAGNRTEHSPSTSDMAGFVRYLRLCKYILSSAHACILEAKYIGF